MRNNRLLGVAIAAALSLPVGVAQAVGLDNVNSGMHYSGGDTTKCVLAQETAESIPVACVLDADNKPHASFDTVTGGAALVNVPVGGIVYARELCVGDGPQKLPNSQTEMVGVVYTISTNTDITDQLKVVFTLSDGLFATTSKLAISDTDGNFTSLPIDIDGGVGKNFVTFLVDASATKPLQDEDQLMFVYQFKSASSLATEGNKVDLMVEIKKKSNDTIIVNPTRTVAVASCKQAVKTELTSEEGGVIKISVSDDSKLFTDGGAGQAGAYIDTDTARIGFLKITNVSTDGSPIMESDGKTQFKIGEGTDGLVAVADPNNNTEGSTLKITNGQFTASRTGSGKVYLCDDTTVPCSEKQTVTPTDDTTATFNLSNEADNLPVFSSGTPIDIRLDVNGDTAIGPAGTEISPPQAALTILFKEDYVQFLGSTDAVNLRQIYKDGTICVVYNVPSAQVTREKINIRITNDSNVDGDLSGKMYASDGQPIGGGSQPLGTVAPAATARFNAASLEAIFGAWEGRAILEITSTLPRLEVLALMRNQFDKSLLTNLSVGATGKSCTR